jgi:FdhD protein
MLSPADGSAVRIVPVARSRDGARTSDLDVVVAEEPLEIRLEHGPAGARVRSTISVTMRTPGGDPELALGFLLGEGILRRARDVVSVRHTGPVLHTDGTTNIVEVALNPEVAVDVDRLQRGFFMSSSCGVCGKGSLESVRVQAAPLASATAPQVDGRLLASLAGILAGHQRVFAATGGLHAAALFTPEGELVALREDVGRHNAVDKLVGMALLTGAVPLSTRILFLSGRAGFELVQKALVAGIPVVAAVGAPTSLAVELARDAGMTLAGFVRDGRFNLYSGEARLA